MKKILSLLLVLVLLVLSAGCAGTGKIQESPNSPTVAPTETATPAPSSDITVTDSRGQAVTLDKVPERMVSLTPSDTEILYALGAGSKLVAVSEYCNYPEDTANKPKLPTGEKLNIESLIALKPDVVFLGKMSVMDDQIGQLEQAGVKVVITEANDLSQTYSVIELIGKVTGKEAEAAALRADMEKGFNDIREQVKGKTPVSVYVEVSPLQYGLWSCGKNTFVQELIDIIGAQNIFSDVEGWAAVSEEQVLQRNPEVIITTASPLTGIQDPVGEIVSRTNWGSIKAVKNNKVLMLDADMLTRPGPRLLDAARELKEAVYK